MPNVLNLCDYREQKARCNSVGALETMVLEMLHCVHFERPDMAPDALVDFLVNAAADTLMANFDRHRDVEALADEYIAFEEKLREALYRRLAEFQ